MQGKFKDRAELIERPPLLVYCHLLRQKHDENDLNYLGGLKTYAEKPVPCPVSGAVVMTEKDETNDNCHIEKSKENPFICNKVRVYNRKEYKSTYAEAHCKALYDDIFTGVLAHGRALDGVNAEDCTYQTHDEQENIRTLKKVSDIHGDFSGRFLYKTHRLSFSIHKYRTSTFCILAHNSPLRNEISYAIIQI